MRAQLLVEAPQRAPLHQFLDAWLTAVRTVKAPRHLRWAIDVDPLAI